LEQLVNHAFAHRQALKEGVPPPSTLRKHGAPPAPTPVTPAPQMTASIPAAQQSGPRPPPMGMLGPMAPAPISAAQAQTALGGPPGGSRAAPSAEQLQQQQGQPAGRNYYRELIEASQAARGQTPPAAPLAQRLRDIQVQPPRRQPTLPAAPIASPERVARVRMRVKQPTSTGPALGTVRGAEEQPPASEQVPTEKAPQPIKSYEEYEKLQSGDHFIWSDGELYRKP
jgi:hypothetical protein